MRRWPRRWDVNRALPTSSPGGAGRCAKTVHNGIPAALLDGIGAACEEQAQERDEQ